MTPPELKRALRESAESHRRLPAIYSEHLLAYLLELEAKAARVAPELKPTARVEAMPS